jgi:hypothetical protein
MIHTSLTPEDVSPVLSSFRTVLLVRIKTLALHAKKVIF